MKNTITVAECFGPTIQGEGPLAGMPTIFVRAGGCDFRCSWCDSMYAVDHKKHGDEWEDMMTDDVLESIIDKSRGFPLLVSLSGGNPALQPFGDLIRAGHEHFYPFALETQGTVSQKWFANLDYLILSPKPPSSGMPFNAGKLSTCIGAAQASGERQTETSLKFVVFDEDDYEFARQVSGDFPALPVYLQAGTPVVQERVFADDVSRYRYLVAKITERTRWLAERVIMDRWASVRVSFQQHVLLWGDKRGV